MTKDEVLKLALEAMTYADACLKKQLTTKDKHEYAQDLLLEAGIAIQEALAQPEQEPVAYASDIEFDEETAIIPAEKKGSLGTAGLNIPLYIAPQSKVLGDAYMAGFNMGQKAAEILPPQRKPLTDEEIWNLAANCLDSVAGRLQFARAIEAAHGIKGEE